MLKPTRLRPLAEAARSARGTSVAVHSAGRSARLHAAASVPSSPAVAVRPAPWLSFNACALPAPAAESSPAFGPNRFLLGANLPWIRYGLDVGASAATPDGGLHADAESAGLLDAALERLRRDGVEHARVFLFSDGRAGIRFSADGTPEGLDAAVFPDVDVLLVTAERHRIGLILVLFDAGLVVTRAGSEGVAGGKHAEVLRDPARRAALLEKVIEPLLRRYGTHPAVAAWDILDEPDTATLGMWRPHPKRARSAVWSRLLRGLSRAWRALEIGTAEEPAPALIEVEAMRAFLGAAVLAVHQHTRALATVGLASTANLPLVDGLGLDFYQAHWWEPCGDGPLRRAVADLRLDRPLVLGAFPATTRTKSVKTVLDTARCAGYGGAFLWSVRSVDARGGQDGQLAQWARNHAERLYRRPVTAEAPAVVAVPEPTPPSEVAPADRLRAPEEGEDDVVRVVRSEPDLSVPGLAAAPG